MKFQPKTEKEIAESGLLPPGTYDFEISSAEEAVSSAGNDMIKLTLHVYEDSGARRTLFDYLLGALPHKLRHAAEVCGLLNDYENGTLDAGDFEQKTGRIKVGIQKDKNGQYPDRNSVLDYIMPNKDARSGSAPMPQPRSRQNVRTPAGDIDDEIPF